MHVPIAGVMLMIPFNAAVPEFDAVNPGIFPVPLAASPMAAFEFVQVNVAPEGLLVSVAEATAEPLQAVKLAGAETVGGLVISTWS